MNVSVHRVRKIVVGEKQKYPNLTGLSGYYFDITIYTNQPEPVEIVAHCDDGCEFDLGFLSGSNAGALPEVAFARSGNTIKSAEK